MPKEDHEKMFVRFSNWLKPNGILEFTSGDKEYEESSQDMLNQELYFCSLNPIKYEEYLKKSGFEILLKEYDQDEHLVWIAKKGL